VATALGPPSCVITDPYLGIRRGEIVDCWSLAPWVLDTDAPRYILYCLGTCWMKLLELGLFELVGGPLIFADAPAMAIAEVLDYPVCLDSVDEGIRVC
jgi:hypothetical protein